MKNLVIVIILAVVIFSVGYFQDMNSLPVTVDVKSNSDEQIEMDLPDFDFYDMAGKKHSISNYKNKIVLLNFWASWCGPCHEEFPEILKVLRAHKDNVILVAISSDEKKYHIKKFFKKFKKDLDGLKANIIIGFDPTKEISSSLFNVIKLPETFVISTDGKIVKKIVGSKEWESDNIDAWFGALQK